MDALEFLRERKRMCKSFNRCSDGCPAWNGSCKLETGTDLECEADKQVEIVNKWAATHPRKTRQSVFLEQWPEAKRADNILAVCPKVLDMSLPCWIYNNANVACEDCRREFWMQEVE
nr:MAG TPA: hypothetical protein [Caudoviricetes sp.]